jgi:hypothetical protein
MADITMQDIKKAYASKANTIEVELCYSGKKVLLRPIKMKDKKEFLKVLESEKNEQIDTFIDKLIERYVADVNEEPVSASHLVDEERRQLLMCLRKISTTATHVGVDHVCPECGELNENVQFALEGAIVENFKKPDDVDNLIDASNGNVKFLVSQLTRQDNIDIDKYITEAKITSDVEKEFITLASTVKELYLNMDDVSRKFTPSIKERQEFVEGLSIDDFEKLKNYFVKCSPFGPKLVFNFKCTKCEYKNEKEEAKIVDFFIK